jgi:hypothetical protein
MQPQLEQGRALRDYGKPNRATARILSIYGVREWLLGGAARFFIFMISIIL